MDLGLGVDTGGTYTDAVIIDLRNNSVLCKSKALTTRNDLVIGIRKSIKNLDSRFLQDVKLVSVSSTLATNSIVEGKGGRVALIVVGYDLDKSIEVDELLTISGGHTVTGFEKGRLDLESATAFVENVRDRVDAFAISSYFSVRNPAHENNLKRMIEATTSLPVVCGHELSLRLGFIERTITAVLNARLIPIVADFIGSMKIVMTELGIGAPLMVVRGDGSLISEKIARERPIETILSGPAASLNGAQILTGRTDGIVVDVGGTTTDVGILRNGRPVIDSDGAWVAGWRTHVRAARIFTSGIGGDSRIVVYGGRIYLTPLRVVPLCIAAKEYPVILEKLALMKTSPLYRETLLSDLNTMPQVTEFFINCRNVPNLHLDTIESKLVNLISRNPYSLYELGEILGIHPLLINIKRLEKLGVIQRIGLTPTDILHVMGRYVEYNSTASRLAVEIQSANSHTTPENFCEYIIQMIIGKLAKELLRKAIHEETGKKEWCEVANDFIDKFITGKRESLYSCQIRINMPIIGVGAPIKEFLPPLSEKFNTEILIPGHAEVANAVGAIASKIIETTEILIRPQKGFFLETDPPSYLYSEAEMMEFDRLSDAINYAHKLGPRLVSQKASASGAENVEILVETFAKKATAYDGNSKEILLELKLLFTGIGISKSCFGKDL